MRSPNTQECFAGGRKLSNIVCDIQVTTEGEDLPLYMCIGSGRDDEIYDESVTGEPMLKERVKVYLPLDTDIELDLEDVLRFAAMYCTGIYERVAQESIPKSPTQPNHHRT